MGLIAGLPLLLIGAAVADDRVTVQPAELDSPITVVGDIQDFNGRRITIRVQSGVPLQTYPTSEVRHVETYYSPEHRQGLAEFESGRVDESQRLFEAALVRESRAWVERELRAWLVCCALMRSDRVTAGALFVEILRSDEETRHWGVAPLIWAPESVDGALRDAARGWLTDRSDGVQLLGASVLLLDQNFGAAARREMDKLTRSSNQSVVEMARSQQWRVRLTEGEVTPRQLAQWNDRIERLPDSLRGGPYYLLGRAYLNRGEFEQAAAGFLWVPLVYNDDRLLAVRASLDAANAMARLGRVDEAVSLYTELVEKYAWSPWAAEAETQLKSYSGTASSG